MPTSSEEQLQLAHNNNDTLSVGSNESRSSRHSRKCHSHDHGHHNCCCIRQFYEDDEVCRKNAKGSLEFGIVSKYDNVANSSNLKVFWTLDREIEEQVIQDVDPTQVRLVDRMASPGDLIKVGNKKQGEVLEVSWNAVIKLQENNSVLLDVACDRLEPLVSYYSGQKIVEENGWIGTITSVYTEATLLFSKGKTAIVDCTLLPQHPQPYPGRRVRYTVNDLLQAGVEKLGGRRLKDLYQGVVEVFVLFLNVASVQVQWSGRISVLGQNNNSSSSDTGATTNPPSGTLSRTFLKRHVKVLGSSKDFNWDTHPEAVDRLYTCIVSTTDNVLESGNVEEYLESKHFKNSPVASSSVGLLGRSSKIMTNVEYVCRVLRFSRILKVKWTGSGKVEQIRANLVTWKHSFSMPYHEIVQKRIGLAPYSYDEYGVTLTRDLHDTVSVKWLSRPRDLSSSSGGSTAVSEPDYTPPSFRTKYQSLEPIYDLEPHFSYGNITPMSIVYRGLSCRLPEPLFSIGWVRSIAQSGQITIISMHTRAEHQVYPNELECTGIRIDGVKNRSTKNLLIPHHGLYNLQISDQLFTQNLVAVNDTLPPEHFKMHQKAPTTHTMFNNKFLPPLDGKWFKAVRREQLYLSTRLDDVATLWLKAYKDRPDLYSVLLAGLQGTPYEGALFTFDVQLGPTFPTTPPIIHCTTVFDGIEQSDMNLELLDLQAPPYKLIECLVALQTNLFTSKLEIPSSAASLHRNSLKQQDCRKSNMTVVINVLDLIFRNVFDPPHLWVNETLLYFNMSYDNLKKKLIKIVDGGEGEDFNVQPVTDGWIDSIVGRLRRIDELVLLGKEKTTTHDRDDIDDDEEEDEGI